MSLSRRSFRPGPTASAATVIAPALLLLIALPAAAQEAPAAVDYDDPASWLCRPDKADDACDVDLDTTVVAPDGDLVVERFVAHPDPPVDCFYVYPTVSNDPGGNSDLEAGPEELGVVLAQFARFGAQCRLFAPLYRQITLTALRARMGGGSMESDRAMAYGDVVDAWNHYLEHDNDGRGVVLVGHSQGAGMLRGLIAAEIDGRPVQERIVSALLLGTNITVPADAEVGGAFQSMPACRTATQTGCIVTYVTFRSTLGPPPTALFGRSREEGMRVACTNPAALSGGAVTLRAYMTTGGVRGDAVRWAGEREITTPFVTVPGLLTGECVERDGASFLEVTVNAEPSDPRTDDIPGDVVVGDEVSAGWGLHLVDVHVVMGDLVDLVGRQGAAWLARQ